MKLNWPHSVFSMIPFLLPLKLLCCRRRHHVVVALFRTFYFLCLKQGRLPQGQREIKSLQRKLISFLKNLKKFIVIQLQLYAFSPHASTPPQPNPPPVPTSTLPLDFVHVSFIVVPVGN